MRRLGLVLFAGALVLAACSDGSGDDGDASSERDAASDGGSSTTRDLAPVERPADAARLVHDVAFGCDDLEPIPAADVPVGVESSATCTLSNGQPLVIDVLADAAALDAYIERGDDEVCRYFPGQAFPFVRGERWVLYVDVPLGADVDRETTEALASAIGATIAELDC